MTPGFGIIYAAINFNLSAQPIGWLPLASVPTNLEQPATAAELAARLASSGR